MFQVGDDLYFQACYQFTDRVGKRFFAGIGQRITLFVNAPVAEVQKVSVGIGLFSTTPFTRKHTIHHDVVIVAIALLGMSNDSLLREA